MTHAPVLRRCLLTALAAAAAAALAAGGAGAAGADPDPWDLDLQAAAGPFDVTLRACTFVEDRLECVLTAHNRLASTVPLQVNGSSLYDTGGERYREAEIRLAGQSDRGPDGRRRPLALAVPGDTPARVEIVFTSVSRLKRKASKLVVEIDGRPRVELGPFPLTRR